jgi:RNA polymerase sigma-70 factor (ECF subfamily)
MKDILFTYTAELKNKIYRFALSILGNEEDARDVVQDAFEKMWKKRFVFSIYKSKEALLIKLTRDLCLDRLKHLKVKEVKLAHLSGLDENYEDPGKSIEEKELYEIIKILISQLPLKQRLVMHLRDIEEKEYEDIAVLLDMEIEVIRMNLSRARKTIGNQINKILDYGTRQNQRTTIKIL